MAYLLHQTLFHLASDFSAKIQELTIKKKQHIEDSCRETRDSNGTTRDSNRERTNHQLYNQECVNRKKSCTATNKLHLKTEK